MEKVQKKHLAVAILSQIIIAIIFLIVTGFPYLAVLKNEPLPLGMFIGSIVVDAFAEIITAVLTCLLLVSFGSYLDHKIYVATWAHLNGKCQLKSPWFDLLKQNKKININDVNRKIRPKLIISIIFLVCFVLLLIPFAGDVTENFIKMYVLVLCSASAFHWFVIWLVQKMYFRKRTCKNCRSVMSLVDYEEKDRKQHEFTQQKTRTSYGKIGDVYADGQKVGELRGNTGETTYERTGVRLSWTSVCRCYYCGEERIVKESMSFLNNWGTK